MVTGKYSWCSSPRTPPQELKEKYVLSNCCLLLSTAGEPPTEEVRQKIISPKSLQTEWPRGANTSLAFLERTTWNNPLMSVGYLRADTHLAKQANTMMPSSSGFLSVAPCLASKNNHLTPTGDSLGGP
ncbi:hypothetical protein Anapl_06201 [Anas platyrhynchos]|uniref:Uncharacterized protein n=1 Tax=Anas platyrhynchos TaxID=8839 RepID=R0L3C0_ANAPL|nr:hypothetical protein Anapl_06201 [Anas platyrhynchos]